MLTVPYLLSKPFRVVKIIIHALTMPLLRTLRYTAFLIATFAPAFYVALTTYHQEMIPGLLVSMAAAKEGTPFPPLWKQC